MGTICVSKPDGSWAQCVPLAKDSSENLQARCRGSEINGCISSIAGSTLQLFVFPFLSLSFEESFLVRQEDFQQRCVRWEDDFRLAAIRATHFNCPNTRCILAVGRGKLAFFSTCWLPG